VEVAGKAKPAALGGGKREDTSHITKRTTAKIRMEKAAADLQPSRTATGKTVAQSSDEDSVTEVLGPALVAGALGRKIGDTRTATMIKGITECRVELLSTRQKAKLPVPAVPNNSAESNSVTECARANNARLALSATSLNVQMELPGDVSEEV